MSLFSKIFSLGDALKRVDQFKTQVEKLERESEGSLDSARSRVNFTRRCSDLRKQLDEQLKRIEALKSDVKTANFDERKASALAKVKDFQKRVRYLLNEEEVEGQEESHSQVEQEEKPTEENQQVEEVHEVTKEGEVEQEQEEKNDMFREGGHLSPEPRPVAAPRLAVRRPSMYDNPDPDLEDESEEEKEKKEEPIKEKPVEAPTPVAPTKPLQVSAPPASPKTKARTTAQVTTLPPALKEEIKTETSEVKRKTETSTTEKLNEPAAVSTSSSLSTHAVIGNRFLVLADLAAERKTDLAIRRGEVLTIDATRPDGWWMAVNERGETGLVPKTFLKHVTEEPPKAARRDVTAPEVRVKSPTPTLEVRRQETKQEGRRLQPDPILKPTRPPGPAVDVRCLGDAFRSDVHLTSACHLAPRLSESNLAFHDLYWSEEADKLRKRRVRVSKLIRLVRVEGLRDIGQVAAGLIRVCVFDQTRRTGRQVVSNVHTIRAQIKGSAWTFTTKTEGGPSIEFSDFVLRSNYRQTAVVMLIEVSAVYIDEQSGPVERCLGSLRLQIVDDAGECRIVNKSYSELLIRGSVFEQHSIEAGQDQRSPYRLVFRAMDISENIISQVDTMPDILVFNPLYIRLLYFYRRKAGAVLLRDRENHHSTELIPDEFLAGFPRAVDEADLMDLLRRCWLPKSKTVEKKSEEEQTREFVKVFMETVWCLHGAALIPSYSVWEPKTLAERQTLFKKFMESLVAHHSPVPFLCSFPSRPMNIYDFAVDLVGKHAID